MSSLIMGELATPVVTCTIYYKNKFLVIRRHEAAKQFGGTWGFPGGKVEQGETVMGALKREVQEETGLTLEDKVLFVDTYHYGHSVGLHFAVFSTSNVVTPEEGVEYKWLDNLEELQELPRIPGIDFHITQGAKLLAQSTALLSIDVLDYVPEKYVN